MKKNTFIAVLLGLSGTFFASAKEYNVDVKTVLEDAKKVQINVETTEQMSSMCGLTVTKLEITNPVALGFLDIDMDTPLRQIKVKFENDPNAMCLMAFGPHRGGIALDIGYSLPNVLGEYDLIINDVNYGKLNVSVDQAATLTEAVVE